MEENSKRKAEDALGNDGKRNKTKKQWRVPRKYDQQVAPAKAIQPGDSGIWVTCSKGREGKCIGEMRDLLNDYAEKLYPEHFARESEDAHASGNIESEIQAEIDDMRRPPTAAAAQATQLFTPVKLDVQCVEPVSLVKSICEDALSNHTQKRTRFAKRLSPMTLIGRATVESLERTARVVLEPHFHRQPINKRKFAIRPTIRNHNILTRDAIIKKVASIVGPGHEVDLKNFDLLIVVEVYQNICGVSVVDNDFEKLKRYNISEIYDPTIVETIDRARESAKAASPMEDSETGADVSASVGQG